MSPAILRRYRAERMLQRDFRALRGQVLGGVSGRLRAAGLSLDRGDLEACYAQAWQGLYAATLGGEEIENARAWLALVTYRRAIEELRARREVQPLDGEPVHEPGLEEALTLQHPDLLGVCLAGAGPSIIALAEQNLDAVEELLRKTFAGHGISFTTRKIRAHQDSEVAHLSGIPFQPTDTARSFPS